MLPDPNPQERRWWGAAVSALTLMLALVRLGQSSLWADESYTANIGLQVLKFGLPRMEGSLFVPESIEWGVRGGIWIWDGWLQYYISAAGEAIFGQTAFGARFFHTLAGALVPWAAYPLFRAIASRRGVAESATLLTGLSVQFLVAIRQARYYPEGILLTVLLLRAYQGGLVGRPRAAWMLALWSVFLFYTNFVWFSLLGVTLLIHLALVRPPLGVSARMAAAGLSALVTILPFALWSRVWDRRWGTSISSQDPYIALSAIRYYLLEINLHGAPMLLLFGAAAYAAGRAHPVRAVLCLLGAVLFPAVLPQSYTPLATWVFALLLVVFGGFGFAMIATDLRKPPGERGWMPWSLVGLVCAVFIGVIPIISGAPFLRYLFPIWPLFAIILAQAVHVLLRPTWLAWSAVAVLLATNALAVWPLRIVDDHIDFSLLAARGRSEAELRQNRFPAFLRGFDYQSAFFMPGWSPEVRPSLDVRAPLADYLTEITVGYRGPVDAIAEYLNAHKRPGDRFATVYEEAAVAFHTGLRPQDNGEGQPPPRWLVVRPTHGPKNDALNFWLQRATYRRIALDAHDTPYQNREELDLHRFRSPVAGPLIELGELVPAGER